MTSRISHTTFDARDAYAQSLFWAQVLGWTENPDDPNEPEHEGCTILSPDRGQRMMFLTVPDGKRLKNRVHLDIQAVDGSREQEVDRLIALGAVQVADHRSDQGGWVVLADPEGNEFCVLHSDWAPLGG